MAGLADAELAGIGNQDVDAALGFDDVFDGGCAGLVVGNVELESADALVLETLETLKLAGTGVYEVPALSKLLAECCADAALRAAGNEHDLCALGNHV